MCNDGIIESVVPTNYSMFRHSQYMGKTTPLAISSFLKIKQKSSLHALSLLPDNLDAPDAIRIIFEDA